MRIGLLAYGSLETISGGNLYDRHLVQGLRRASHEVEVLSLNRSCYPRHLAHNFHPRLHRRIAPASFDVLLQDELTHPSLLWLNRRLHRRVAYPIVAVVHHLRSQELRPAWQNAFYRFIERRYLKTCQGFICNSRHTRSTVEELVGFSYPMVVAFPAADHLRPEISHQVITQRALASGPLRLLFVGNVIQRKGLDNLLAAATHLKMEAWRLEVVGSSSVEPSHFRHLERRVREARLSERVRFHGSVSEENLRQLYACSHLVVVPSSHEGFGIAYLEGMAFGLPAIATTAGGAGELVRQGENGFLVSPGDAAALARQVATLARDRQRLARMGLAARQTYEMWPTWSDSTEIIGGFLAQMVEAAQARAIA